ncbi:MAG: hypothetical protein LBR22_00600 [Desulfovibrio sp.]|nr:hypothetical protein [Desulfovibrio sp.]
MTRKKPITRHNAIYSYLEGIQKLKKNIKITWFDVIVYLETEEDIAEYLTAAKENTDQDFHSVAIDGTTRAHTKNRLVRVSLPAHQESKLITESTALNC